MAVELYKIPEQADAFDPAADSIIVSDRTSVAGTGHRSFASLAAAVQILLGLIDGAGAAGKLAQFTDANTLTSVPDQAATKVYAGPPFGAPDASPTFRILALADIPSLSSLYEPVGSSVVTITVSGGVAFVYGDIGYLLTDGTIRKAQSNGTAEQAEGDFVCMTAAGVASGSPGSFRFAPGTVTGLTGGTIGKLAYVSSTAGAITITPPATGYSKILGRWFSATTLLFNTDRNTYFLG